jgi:hypothetical protein
VDAVVFSAKLLHRLPESRSKMHICAPARPNSLHLDLVQYISWLAKSAAASLEGVHSIV